MQSCMSLDKKLNLFSFMPPSSINVNPNRMPIKSFIKMPQTTKKPFSVSLRPSHQSLPSQQRNHPSEEIKPLTMLTRCRNPKLLPCFNPSYPKARMKRKSRLILKDNGLLRTQGLKLFLTSAETAWPLHSLLEDMNNPLASADSPTVASKIGPGEPLALFENTASDKPPRWGRPNELDLTQTPKAASRDVLPIPATLRGLNEPEPRSPHRLQEF